ncbi:MAG: response regulator [Pedobacter sp.]|nr:response regulator [Pedobacter sp.]
MTKRIAIVEDEPELAELMRDYLQQAGYRTRIFDNGATALAAFRQDRPDFIVLDLMLPGMDGVMLCRELRAFSDVPVMMVTARVEEVDRLIGLETGADDYLCKPFSPRELVARVKAILRRPRQPELEGAEFRIDKQGRRVEVRGLAIDLTPTEFLLLSTLIEHPGQIFSRAKLLDIACPDDLDVTDRAVDSHIKNLRKKLAEFFPEADLIQSVYGVGYRFELP